ncbi:MAG TPA: 4Fe-4S binding protein, partial [Phycisphaerales bacterium]|nr:4Fe-4S binding protein [Phycisphaerales bacterium]
MTASPSHLHCSPKSQAGSKSVSLPVIPGDHASTHVRRSKAGPRRAAVLITVQLLLAAHIVYWLLSKKFGWFGGQTLTPIEPSEGKSFTGDGIINTGLIFFALALLSTLVLGRWFCGWGCHIVMLQDFCGWLMKKIGIRPKPFRSRLLVYVPLVLAIYMFLWPGIYRFVIVPIDARLAAKYGDNSPLVLNIRNTADLFQIPLGSQPPPWKASTRFTTDQFWATFPSYIVAIPFLLICGFGTVYFLGAKGFCTYGCPYGGFFAPLDKLAPARIRVTDACNHCGHCTAVCTSNVRVHDEVREYGMVVDPGCMKCLDCVSVCPNDALYIGFGAPALLKGRAKKAKPKRHYDMTLFEELVALLMFVFTFYSIRGVYDTVPLLMAAGVSACFTFLAWKSWRVIRDYNAAFHHIQLKLKGGIRPAGLALLIITFVLFTFTAHCAAVQMLPLIARHYDLQVRMDPGLVFSPSPLDLPGEMTDAARKADTFYTLASSVKDGGIALVTTPDLVRRRAALAAMLHDFSSAEKFSRRMLVEFHPVPADVHFFIDLLYNQERFDDTYQALNALADRFPDDPLIIDTIVSFFASSDRVEQAITVCNLGLAHNPDNLLLLRELSLLQLNINNYDEGIRLILKTIEIDP